MTKQHKFVPTELIIKDDGSFTLRGRSGPAFDDEDVYDEDSEEESTDSASQHVPNPQFYSIDDFGDQTW